MLLLLLDMPPAVMAANAAAADLARGLAQAAADIAGGRAAAR